MQVDYEQQKKKQEDLIKTLDQEIEQSLGRAKQISKDQDIVWHDEINFLAEKIERKYQILDQEWAISNICQEITRLYREQEIKIWPWVRDYLPSRFKNNNFNNAINKAIEDFTSSPRGQPRDLIEQFQYTKQNIWSLPREIISEINKISGQIKNASEKRAAQEHIALEPDENSSSTDQQSDQKQQDMQTIDKPEPHGSLLHKAIGRSIQTLQYVQSRVFDFPPEILDKDKDYADGFDAFNSLFDSALDLKYSKNSIDWFLAEKYRDLYGKHAAAVLSFSVSNLCANCSNEETREWVRMEPVTSKTFDSFSCLQCGYKIDTICPSCNIPLKLDDKPIIGWQCGNCGGTTPMTRDLTREQIGDKSSIVMEAALKVLDHIPVVIKFCAWFRDWIEPLVAGRKLRLSGPLSDKA